MSNYHNRGTEGAGSYVTLMVLLGAGMAISYVYNAFGFLAGVLTILAIAGAYSLIKYIENRQKENKQRIVLEKPCVHGVSGAVVDINKCIECKKIVDEKEFQRQNERQKRFDEWKAKIRLPDYLRKMDPREFEILVCNLYKQMGYKVEVTPYVADGGIDGFLRRGDNLYLLQCKRVKGGVGEPVLRDLYGSIIANKAHGGIVVTTGRVSSKAKKWIGDKAIDVIEIEKLSQLIKKVFSEDSVVPKEFEIDADIHNICPKCGKPLRKVSGRRGKFFGCSSYPSCRFTKPIKSSRRYSNISA